MPVLVRPAEIGDVPHIVAMVNRFADQNIMLPRTIDSVTHTLADWLVAVEEWPEPTTPPILGCGALVPLTDTLAEVRSLAVHESQQGQGLGGVIVLELVQIARVRGYEQVCALTLRENFSSAWLLRRRSLEYQFQGLAGLHLLPEVPPL